jgi:streptomycin 6-kinase
MSETNKLNHYLAAWELSNPHLLTQTITSQIYTVTHGGDTVVLKVLSPSETEEQRGALSLRYFDGQGVCAFCTTTKAHS